MTPEELTQVLSDHKVWLAGTGGKRADLSYARLCWADLRGAYLSRAKLRGADLYKADLSSANLSDANLSDADLCWANMRGAYLSRAKLRDANMNWQSHDLLAEVLRQAAGDNADRRMLAGLVLVSRDWCWKEFMALDHPETEWAKGVLREYVTANTPANVREWLGEEAGK